MNERTLRVLEFNKIVEKLVNMAASDMGKEAASSLMPKADYSQVQDMLKETSDGVDFIVRRGNPPLGGIHDIRNCLKRVEIGAVLNPGELLKIADSLRACRNLKNYADSTKEGNRRQEERCTDSENSVYNLIGCLSTNKRMEDKIQHSILNDEEVSDNASSALSSIRRKIRELQNSIKNKLDEISRSQKYKKYMQDSIVTMRGDRYVVPVKQEYRSEIPGIIHDSSSSGATIFIEPMAVVEANNNIRQQKIKEKTEIERILYELTASVADIMDDLVSNISILARLDFIFAKAKLSVEYQCVCPQLNNCMRTVINKGRHPLLDRESVVPIDFKIGENYSTLIITGPNTGGKTVSLKTIGLLTLMMQAGLHIPASDGTDMNVYKKVFADIGDEQSIEQSLSTFSSHMTNIIQIMNNADDKSLVLLDELGAGTDPTEGAALSMSILDGLRRVGAVTVATTHYSELKIYAISTKYVENASCEFDVQTLRPTYRLLTGVPGKSNAFAISQRLGLTNDILIQAKNYLKREDIKFEDILINIEKNKSDAEKERIKAERLRIEIENMKKELEQEKQKMNIQKHKLISEAKEEARGILKNTRRETETILEEIKKIEKERQLKDRDKATQQFKTSMNNKINTMEEELVESLMPRKGYIERPKNLKSGDSVYILNLSQKGTVLTPPDKDGEVAIQVGIIRINAHVTNLKLIDEQKVQTGKIVTGMGETTKARNISNEIDLRGLSVDEAIENIDKFLDDASIAGLNEVTIIHGKGTGVLRSGIQKFLKTNPHVRDFRIGRYGEGEQGVTVVEIK